MDKPIVSGASQNLLKQARQLAYDVRYKVKKQMKQTPGSKMDPASVFRAYMAELGKSKSTGPVKAAAKKMLSGVKEEYVSESKDLASDSIANALFKVFVENQENNSEESIQDLKEFLSRVNKQGERIYHIRVTDKKTGNTYTRDATRSKISELRANPNIASVEMTELDKDSEGEKTKGEYTAKVKAGKDWDGDGKVESGAKEYRGAVHNAIQRKKGGTPDGKDTSNVKEEFLADANDESLNTDANKSKIDVMNGKNTININPEVPGTDKKARSFQYAHYEPQGKMISETGYNKFLNRVNQLQEKAESEQQQKLFGLALSVKRGETPRSEASAEALKIVDTMSEKKIRDFAKTKHEGIPKKVKEEMECGSDDDKKKEIDPRQLKTIKSRMTTTLGLMGIKASYEPEGELVDEERREFRSLGRPDRNDGRNRYGGSATPQQEREEKAAADTAAKRAKAQLAREAARKNRR